VEALIAATVRIKEDGRAVCATKIKKKYVNFHKHVTQPLKTWQETSNIWKRHKKIKTSF
jgi:hypothetical protein